jgi:hypothetical protein
VHERHRALAHEAAERAERAGIEGAAHGDRGRGEALGFGLALERTAGLASDEDLPAVIAEPAALGEDADLLTAEAGGRLRVEDYAATRRGLN